MGMRSMEENNLLLKQHGPRKSKTLWITVLSVGISVIVLAGGALGIWAFLQKQFETQTIRQIENRAYEEACSSLEGKHITGRQKSAFALAFSNAVRQEKITTMDAITPAQINYFRQLKQLGESLDLPSDQAAMAYVGEVLKLERYFDGPEAVFWEAVTGPEMDKLGQIVEHLTDAMEANDTWEPLLPELRYLLSSIEGLNFSAYPLEDAKLSELNAICILFRGGLTNMYDGIWNDDYALYQKGGDKVTSAERKRINLLEEGVASMDEATALIEKLPANF